MGLPRWHSGKEFTCNAGDSGDVGSIPGPGRSPREGNGNLLQYSCLGNPMDREAWRLQSWGHKELDMTEQLTLLLPLRSITLNFWDHHKRHHP